MRCSPSVADDWLKLENSERLLLRRRSLQNRRGNVVDGNAGRGFSLGGPVVRMSMEHRSHSQAVDWFL